MQHFTKAGLLSALFLAACQPLSVERAASVPDWVAAPQVKEGLAATSCVAYSGHFDIDKKQAIANARQELVQQISLRVKTLDETYARKTQAAGGAVAGGVFESVSRQVAEETLSGSVPEKVAVLTIAGKEQMCAMVTLQPERTRTLFAQLVSAAKVSLAAQDEAALYEEFKAFKAQERLDRALEQTRSQP